MTASASIPFDSFREIRDKALLMTLGSAYLCDSPFLARYGAELEYALSLLDRDIRNLKERFPGKSAQEVDTDGILGGIRDLAGKMKDPDRALRKKCAAGELGMALEEQVKALSDAVKEVRRQVDGDPGGYSGAEALTGTFLHVGQAVRGGFGILGKIVGVVLLSMVVAFGYLFITMERESAFEKEIAARQERIRVLQEDLSRLEKEKIAPLEAGIQKLEREGTGRSDKIRNLAMSVELGELEQEAMTLRGEIKQHRTGIQSAEESLEILKQKGFFERLMRQ